MLGKRLHSVAVLITIALLVGVTANAFAGGINAGPDSRSIEGSWVVGVDIQSAPPGFPNSFTALETYSRGGGLVTSNNIPAVPRPGQGAWDKDGPSYAVAIVFFTFDSTGAQAGSIHVKHTVKLENKDQYTGEGRAEFLDNAGNTLFEISFTTKGERISSN